LLRRGFNTLKVDASIGGGLGVGKVEPQHVKITIQGLILPDDAMLQVPPHPCPPPLHLCPSYAHAPSEKCVSHFASQEVQVMWQKHHPSSLLQLTFYVCSPSEVWGVWQEHALQAKARK
jgi:hypothetical protein